MRWSIRHGLLPIDVFAEVGGELSRLGRPAASLIVGALDARIRSIIVMPMSCSRQSGRRRRRWLFAVRHVGDVVVMIAATASRAGR